jgi:glycosyltransferase involved in cell wall biosynthesis
VKIAFIVHRYGTDILGGSETQCRLVAERIAERHQVDVLTTCAHEDVTWANQYPEGADRLRGVTVRRFATSRTRDLAAFNRFSDRIFNERHTRQDELEWLKQQGPWSPGLIEYLERHHHYYDVLVFFTYRYAPTVLGIKVAPSKSLLVPAAHDDPALRLETYRDVFASAAAVAWDTEAERRFVTSRFDLRALAEDVVGCGIDLPEAEGLPEDGDPAGAADAAGREPLPRHLEGPANQFRRRHRIHEPFVLYAGRVDPGQGCEQLLEYFQTYVNDGGDASLFLMGAKLMPLPEDPHVRFAGVLPEEERFHALEAATVVVVPAPHETLSLTALEAMAVGTPVLVTAESSMLVEHCRQSNAGLFYADRWEFSEALKLLMKDAALRKTLGRNGRRYVHGRYRWSTIATKYERLFAALRGPVHDGGPADRDRSRFPDRDRDRDRNRDRADRGRERGDRGRERGPDRGRERPQGRPTDRDRERGRDRGRRDRGRPRGGDRNRQRG